MDFLNEIILLAKQTAGEGGSIGQAVQPVVNKFFEIAGIVFPIVLGVGAILIIIRLILLGVKLAQSGDDPEARSRIIKGMIWWGIGLVVIVAATIVSAVVFNMLVHQK